MDTRTWRGIAAAVAISLAAGGAYAQDGADAALEADIFGGAESPSGFDATVASGEKAQTEILAGGTIVVKAASTVAPSGDTAAATTLAAASGKLFAKVSVPDYGTLYAAVTAAHPLFQGYSGPGPAPAASDQYAPSIALSEFHYSFDVGKKLFFRIGNQLVAWGPSLVWSPVDFINLERATSLSELDVRKGKSGFRVHVPFQKANLFAFADFSGMTATGTYGDPLKTVNLGGRADLTVSDFEFGLTAYGGNSATPRFGADASGRLLGTTVYGEFAVSPYADFSGAKVMASAGFSRTLDELKRWTLSAEGFYNSEGKDLSSLALPAYLALPANESANLYQGMWYAWASLQADELGSKYLTTTVSGLANLQDGSYTVKLAEAFAFPRAVPFTFSVAYSGGGKDKEFTRFAGDNSLTFTAYTSISF